MHSCPVTHGKVNGTLTLFSEYAQSKLFNDASMDKLSALVCPLKHHYMGTYFYKCEGPEGGVVSSSHLLDLTPLDLLSSHPQG